MSQFTHLHLHTEYSLLESTIRIKDLVTSLKEMEYSHCAITDIGNMFGAIEFHHKLKDAGINPIIGMSAYVVPNFLQVQSEGVKQNYQTIFLCQNKEGYHNLTYLASKGYTQGKINGIPYIDHALIEQHHQGLIAISGGIYGEIGARLNYNQKDDAYQIASWYQDIFSDRYYIELQTTGLDDEARVNQMLMTLAQELSLPVVGTNSCFYLKEEDADAHYMFQLFGLQKRITETDIPKQLPAHTYLKSQVEMQEVFKNNHFPEEALTNTMSIAEQCDLDLSNSTYYLPQYTPPTNHTLESWFEHASKEGLKKRLTTLYDQYQPDTDFETFSHQYNQRLEFELRIINQMNYAGYFLIVADFINWAKENNISVGPGRGSGAGSIIAYALRITDVDPIKYGLLFERFLNPDRVSLPDFDIDFGSGRDRVIQYVKEKYGNENVCQISTFQSLGAKAVIRGLTRVLDFSYVEADKIAKLIPAKQPPLTLPDAISQEIELQKLIHSENEKERTLMQLSLKLEGLKTHLGTHAAGIIIMDHNISDIMPICKGKDDSIQSMFTMNYAEDQGAVKFDFLGLQNLDIIQQTINILNSQREQKINIDEIPLDNQKTFELLSEGKTTGVFQLESHGMKKILISMKPSSFEDIVATVALYRPGPLQSGMVDTFINCKHGKEKITYLHPLLQPILSETYGVMVYQEQVMQSAQNLALFSLSQADLLRRAMGKKKPEELAKQRQIFIDGCLKNNEFVSLCHEESPADIANNIFERIDYFSGYGFNKSHSVAYGLVSYHTAYLKANYPIPLMTTLLNCSIGDSDKLLHFIKESYNMGVKMLTPDINDSLAEFSISTIGYQVSAKVMTELKEYFQENELVQKLKTIVGENFDTKEKYIKQLEALFGSELEKYQDKILYLSKIEAVRFGLCGIKSLSSNAVNSIIEARQQQKDHIFEDFIDLFKFTDLSSLSKKATTTLIQCGSFDSINSNRALLLEVLEQAYLLGQSYQKEIAPNQNSLFDLLSSEEMEKAEVYLDYPDVKPWSQKELLAIEKETIGFYVSGHPLDSCTSEITSFTVDINAIGNYAGKKESFYIIGIISSKIIKMTKSLEHFAIITLEDLTDSIEIPIYAKLYEQYQDVLIEGEVIIIKTQIYQTHEDQNYEKVRFNIESIELLNQFREKHIKSLHLSLDLNHDLLEEDITQVSMLSQMYAGETPTIIHLTDKNKNKISIKLKEKVNLSSQFIDTLQENINQFQIGYSYNIN